MTKQLKTSKNNGIRSKNFYLIILEYIKTNSKLPSDEYLNMSKQNRQYYINKLKQEGIIYKIGYGVWNVDPDKYNDIKDKEKVKTTVKHTNPSLFKRYLNSKKNIRGHGFCFTVSIPKIKKWENRINYLNNNNIKYKMVGNTKKYPRIAINKHKIWLTDKSIVIFFPKNKSYFSDNAESTKKYATYDLLQLIKRIERLLNINIKIDKEYRFKISKNHYARLDDEMAKIYKDNKSKIRVIGRDGKEWLISDLSNLINEAETTNTKTANTDMDKVFNPFMNDLKDHYDNTRESLTMTEIMKLINELTKRQIETEKINNETAAGLNSIVKLIQNDKISNSAKNFQSEKPRYIG